MQWRSYLEKFAEGYLGGDRRLIVVSNREPYAHERRDGKIVCTEPAGGVTAALQPLLRACGGVWVAHGSGAADAEAANGKSTVMVPPGRPGYALRRVWIPEELHGPYYNGLANRALWPLCHNVYQRPRFAAAEWESYRRVNALFAEAVLEEANGGPALVFVQDYHLALLPRLLRRRNPRLAIAHFWHIPWPDPDVFAAFPWGRELLDGLLGSDVAGFHLPRHCDHFLRAAAQLDETFVDFTGGRVLGRTGVTAAKAFPIGIDFEGHCRTAAGPAVAAAAEEWKRRVGDGARVIVGIDRLDYTKGIPERLRGLDLLLERRPEWREKLVYVQVAAPSRGGVPEYAALAAETEQLAAAVNARWGTARRQPVLLVRESLPKEQTMALERIADVCLVTPLHDGMNLVAKEFAATRQDLDGVLVLSRFAGAAAELDDALLVNPFAEEELAETLARALAMPRAERRIRMQRMRTMVERNDAHRWGADIFAATAEAVGWTPRVPAAMATRAGAQLAVSEIWR